MIKFSSFDIQNAPLEIERKYLIRFPDIKEMEKMHRYRVAHIEQTYILKPNDRMAGRVRKRTVGENTKYIFTCKMDVSDLTRHEFEALLTKDEYERLVRHKKNDTETIIKDRHSFEYLGFIYEIDIYPFWSDRAIMECEVSSEDTEIPVPSCISVIKDVTSDRRYRNSSLSRVIITEKLD